MNYAGSSLEKFKNGKYTLLFDKQYLSKYNKRLRFLLSIIDIYSKYAYTVSLKDKRFIRITHLFQKILNESGHKPNKIWVDRSGKFYNRSKTSWLLDNSIQYYLKRNLLLLRDLS